MEIQLWPVEGAARRRRSFAYPSTFDRVILLSFTRHAMRKLDPVRHEGKRQEILDAAGRCFLRNGFQGASISEICSEAEISPGHLYHYFDSKEAIIMAMVEGLLERTAAQFSKVAERSDAIATVLTELKPVRAPKGGPGHRLALEVLAGAGRDPAMAKVLQKHTRGMHALLADLLRKCQSRGEVDPALDPAMAASILISVTDGSKFLTVRDPKLDSQKAMAALKILITRFLSPPQAKK